MIYELKAQALLSINITEIDELNKLVTYKETMVGYPPNEMVRDFDAGTISSELAEDFFYFSNYWDYNFNRAILSNFDFGYFFQSFVLEPDWTTFNENFVEVLDENQTIAALDTGYEIQYIFLSDFLEAVSFNINGKDNLVEAKNSFYSDTTKWTFEFDFSDLILDRDYNYDEDIYEYFEYNNYEANYELEYTEGGILSEMRISKFTSITKDNVKYTYEEDYSLLFGSTGTASIDYNFVSAIIVIILLPVLLPIRKKRKSS